MAFDSRSDERAEIFRLQTIKRDVRDALPNCVTHETLLCDFSVEFHIQFSCVDHYIYVTFLVWERAKNQEYDMKKTHI